jgi:alpha-tubulin suppressor-like RCC1 family protein
MTRFHRRLVAGLGAVIVKTASYHSCALTSESKVTCWGSNNYGNLGAGVAVGQSVGCGAANKCGAMGNSLSVVELGAGGQDVKLKTVSTHT